MEKALQQSDKLYIFELESLKTFRTQTPFAFAFQVFKLVPNGLGFLYYNNFYKLTYFHVKESEGERDK